MKIKSFGKINLNLRVLDEVINGLHKIESLIIPIDFYDVIEIKEIDNDKDIITFDSTDIPDNNTVSKTLDLIRKTNDFSQYFEINIIKNIKIIDARKPFEFNMGTFKGAENPNIDNFRDFPNYLKKINKKKPIAMFCTGGIRCEKATNYLVKKGYKKVYQLKGGIINYLKNINIKSSLWSGECYVFDNRVSLKHKLKLGTYIICSGCRKPVSKDEKKSKKYQMGISCPKCYDKLSSSQKERFAMRQKQILLAKKMGKNYLFKKEYY